MWSALIHANWPRLTASTGRRAQGGPPGAQTAAPRRPTSAAEIRERSATHLSLGACTAHFSTWCGFMAEKNREPQANAGHFGGRPIGSVACRLVSANIALTNREVRANSAEALRSPARALGCIGLFFVGCVPGDSGLSGPMTGAPRTPYDRWYVSAVNFGDHTLRCPLWCPSDRSGAGRGSRVHAQHPTTTDIAAPSGHSRPHPAYPPQNVITTTPVTDRQPSVLTKGCRALVNVRPSTSTRRSSSW